MPIRAPRPSRPNALQRSREAFARAPLAVALMLAGMAAGAQAQSLVELYQAARGYDAAYLAAKAQADSTEYKAAQARGQRLPQIGLKGSIYRQHFDSDLELTTAQRAALAATGTNSNNYSITSKSLALQARQSLFNAELSAIIDQADQSLIAADADLKTA